jgi:hypothetical protein
MNPLSRSSTAIRIEDALDVPDGAASSVTLMLSVIERQSRGPR